ncbi:MAG: TIGR00282 family metallophosphoesterase [Kiritimatiellae bacterium]|nr:TIGR00282 family metallophosphoesterase [Kiritimatiellia bacterium]MBQ3344544.1 TIGR00282 family metallophosphoesterase [Kiritimatiellia bacterium]MBQ6330269.1 TIGR00282 family metallophosphoesterase [Kiritimatiellia bacterium]
MRIVMIGDVVGSPGRRMLRQELKRLRGSLGAGAVVVNAENCAAGSGITAALAGEIFEAGADAITLGDHTWGQKEFAGQIASVERLVRPANFPSECPGRGWCVVTMPTFRFVVVNVLGRVFMNPVDCPFKAMDRVLAEVPKDVPVFVDFHAEATSEKITMGHYLDGRVTAVVGTHTHVQTSDAMLLPKGTAYLTDLGMTGPYVSSIGRDLRPVTRKFVTGMPSRFEVADGPSTMEGAIIDFDPSTKRASSIETFRIREQG